MASDLTGDYDLVAEFSLGAVNRILAAMHRGNRLPHALSMAVDDLPDFRLGVAAVSIVDKYGDALTDVNHVKQSAYATRAARSIISEEVIRNVDPVVNWRPDPAEPREMRTMDLPLQPDQHRLLAGGIGNVGVGLTISEDFSLLSGIAQLQLGPPTMQLPANSTTRANVHSPVMIRYIPDAHTRPLSVFMRGDIVTTFGVKHAASPAGTNIVVDLAGTGGNVHFTPAWSANSLDADDRAAIDKALSKSLRQSFQPSSTPVPSNVKKLHFKGFPAEGGVGVMMNVTTQNNPSPDSVPNGFLRPEDHFALGVNGDAITVPFAAAVNAAITPRETSTDTKIVIDYWVGTKTFHIFTNVTVLDAKVELMDLLLINLAGLPSIPGTGAILLTIPVQVRFGWENKPTIVPDPVDFDFTIVQAFTLTLNGRHVGLQRLGDVAVNFPPGVPAAETNPAEARATTLFNNAWNSQESQIQAQVDNALNADGLQSFLKSLMNPKAPAPKSSSAVGPPGGSTAPKPEEVNPDLAYTYFEIRPSGIILHGALAVPPWPAPHVEFDKDVWAPYSNPEYRALKSWIPGGTITDYHWNFGKGRTLDDANRFVTVNAPPISIASSSVCLTLSGSRITAWGPVAYERVSSGRACKWTVFALIPYTGVDLSVGNRPHVIVPKPRPDPELGLEVVGHASPWAPEGISGGTSNFIVHFPDDRSARQLDVLPRALAHSERTDTATAILCVLTPEQVSTVQIVDGLMYADDADAWERFLEIRDRPATVVLDTAGRVVWRHEGELGGGELAEAARTHLAADGRFYPQFFESSLRVGELSPNFLFEPEPGERLTLRNVTGRPVVLVFWRSSSAASLATLRNLHRAFTQPDVQAPLIVAINDGESGEFARGLAAGEEGAVVVVADPERQISRAYGVNLWPTIVFLDAEGIVRDIRFGLITEEELETSARSRRPESRQQGKDS